MKEQFISWLESEKPKSVRHYTYGYNTVEKILSDNNLPSLNSWSLLSFKDYIDKINLLESFNTINKSGNNILTATLSNYKKFMEVKEETMQFDIPPIKPFENFKWRWAVTTPSEGINTPEILIGVLDLLYKHNGQKHATQEFQDDLLDLQTKLDTKIDLAKIDRGLNKNIIENSGQYWKALGLLENSTGGVINLTRLGISIAEGSTNYDEFVKHLYSNFRLPNNHIESEATIQEWHDNNIQILPIKLIFNLLFEIKRNSNSPTNWYITPEELKDIVIPLSAYPNLPMNQFVNEIFGYRLNTKSYESWPDCTPGDNDFRMVKEYLLFLSNFGYLDLIELKNKSKRYYLNSKSIKDLEKDYDPIENKVDDTVFSTEQIPFDINTFSSACENAGLIYEDKLITRYISSLTTKPFVILSGLSGSGKTKLAQSFAQWLCEDETQYALVPVGADWTNREPLLGYVNALNNSEYIVPENGALQLILRANENKTKPYFLILDEMNLSHVERYFADFLSVMESKDSFKLHSDKENKKSGVPYELSWPKNLFVVGTVNIDETTYMFSPKVLDRANVIEFRVNKSEIEGFLKAEEEITSITKMGASMGSSFVSIAKKELNETDYGKLNSELLEFFKDLQVLGAEFGYRTASEIQTLFSKIDLVNPEYSNKVDEKIDIAIMQKLLPKLHGSRRKLLKTLNLLTQKCLTENQEVIFNERGSYNLAETNSIKYELSFEKIARIYKNAIENGFASYAEA